MTDRFCKHLTAGFAGLIAFITYAITMAPTLSFWDCGEFIASAYTLGIPHPPGTPFFVFFARVVIILLPMVDEIAKRVNYISVVTSAATVYVTVIFAWDLLAKLSKDVSRIIFISASLCAGFLLMFSDTFWFNAVEAEVYGFAMFLVMLISYLALIYLNTKEDRYLILICYLAFLGIGVHLYTMITIPAIFILLLFADGTPFKTLKEKWPLWITGVILFSAVYAISSFIIWSVILMITLFVARLTTKDKNIGLALAFTVVALIGFSTHLYIPIRSELNPIIDENDPEINFRDENGKLILKNFNPRGDNWQAFHDYLERKQYGSESMINRAFYRRAQIDNQILVFPHMSYGGYQIAQYTPFKVGKVSYFQRGIYSIDPEGNEPLVRGPLKFPTLMSSIGENEFVQAIIFLLFNGLLVWIIVIAWRKNLTVGIYLALLYGICSAGLIWYINFSDGTKLEKREYDSWVREMEYVTSRISEQGGTTAPRIPDPNELLNVQRKIYADYAKGDKPSKHEQSSAWQNWRRIQAMFQSVGAQALPLPDPVHLEVRERDYFYAPAYIIMSLLYGLGIGFLLLNIRRQEETLLKPSAIAVTVLCFAIPLFANYKEHNRANLWVPWDYAYNLLMSCEPNAILFTNGDNDTFPLWFAQEVAGIRKDVRVVNLSLGNTDWYIKQMLDNPPVLKLSHDKAGIEREFALNEHNFNMPQQKIDYWVDSIAGKQIPRFARRVEVLEDRLYTAETAEDSAKINAEIERAKHPLQIFTALRDWGTPRKGGIMQTQYKLVVDLAMMNPDKPIHLSTTVGLSNAVGLDKYMVQKGMILDLVKGTLIPVKDNSMDVERTAFLVDSVFQFRGLGDGTAYLDGETKQYLYNYNTIYMRLAMAMNDLDGLRYADLGIKQFPEEWRNYAVAAELLLANGNVDKAIEYLENGLKENSDNRYLQQQLELLKRRE